MKLYTGEIKIENRLQKKSDKLFQLKSKNPHRLCVIYKGTCTCKESYTGETKRNVEIQRDTQKDSKLAKHLRKHAGQSFT